MASITTIVVKASVSFVLWMAPEGLDDTSKGKFFSQTLSNNQYEQIAVPARNIEQVGEVRDPLGRGTALCDVAAVSAQRIIEQRVNQEKLQLQTTPSVVLVIPNIVYLGTEGCHAQQY